MTNQDIADQAGLARTTVARELGIEPPKPMSLPLAQRLGDILGFDPGYIALAHARDTIWAQARSNKHDHHVRQRLERISARLARYVRTQQPFRIDDRGRRLAFRSARCRRQLSPERIAHHARGRDGITPSSIRRYEVGLGSGGHGHLENLLAALSASSPQLAPMTQSGLDRQGDMLAIAHDIADTIEWYGYKNTVLCGHRLHCPCEPGYELSVGLSPTLWNVMEVKLIRVTQPRTATRARVRILGRQPKGVQMGIVVRGKVELTLSSVPFSGDEDGRRALQPEEQPGVVYARRCKAGDVIIAPGNHHYRLDFLSRSCLVAILILRGNMLVEEPRREQGPGGPLSWR